MGRDRKPRIEVLSCPTVRIFFVLHVSGKTNTSPTNLFQAISYVNGDKRATGP